MEYSEFVDELISLKKLKIGKYDDYIHSLIRWYSEIAIKNRVIHSNKNNEKYDREIVDRPRGYVYWVDFGINIGSEFNDYHWCVVLKELKYTALVVPFSSEKEDDPEWKNANNLIVKIGCISSLPFDKTLENYAMINQMRCMSKQRLSPYTKNGVRYDKIKLESEQLNIIDRSLLTIIADNTYIKDSFSNDYY